MKFAILILVGLMLASCSKPEEAAAPAQPAPPAHNYQMKDGREYGYRMAISENQRAAGQVGARVLTYRYLGKRDGRHQLVNVTNNLVTVLECAEPCQFIKVMSFIDAAYLRDKISVERVEAAPNTVGALAFEDAINGQLDESRWERNGKRHRAWMDQREGWKFIPE